MKRMLFWLAVFASTACVAHSVAVHADASSTAVDAPAFDRKVNLVYTINNLGYTDTCG